MKIEISKLELNVIMSALSHVIDGDPRGAGVSARVVFDRLKEHALPMPMSNAEARRRAFSLQDSIRKMRSGR